MGEWVRPVDQDLDHRHSNDALSARGTLDTGSGSVGDRGRDPTPDPRLWRGRISTVKVGFLRVEELLQIKKLASPQVLEMVVQRIVRSELVRLPHGAVENL